MSCVGHVIFSLHLGVVHSVLCQMEGVGHAFSNHHIAKCSDPLPPPPPSVLFDQSLSHNLLAEPRFNLKTYGDRTFTVAAPTIWNSLPLELRACVSVSTFKSKLRLGYSAKLFS